MDIGQLIAVSRGDTVLVWYAHLDTESDLYNTTGKSEINLNQTKEKYNVT